MNRCIKKESENQSTEANIQKDYLNSMMKDSKMVNIIIKNGFQIKGFIEGFDDQVLIITKCNNGIAELTKSMIYKSAISTIEPIR